MLMLGIFLLGILTHTQYFICYFTGIRKFAHDEELRQKANCFIQNNIDEVTKSKHFYGLPRVKIEIVGADEDLIESSNDKHMFQLVLSWARQNINPEKPRLEELTEQVNVLYLNPDNTLSDCKDFSSADQIVKEDDVIYDYKKAKTKLSVPVKPKDSLITSPAHFRKFAINPEEPVASKEWNIIATYQTKDNMYMAISLLNGEMATMSIHYRPRAVSPTGSTSDGPDSPTLFVTATQVLERHASLTPLAFMSSARCAFGLRVINGKLFACGGYDRGDCLISCEEFDLKTNTWNKLADMNTPRGRFATASLNEKVYAIGGSNGHHEQKMVEIYDAETNKWTLCSDAIKAKVSQGVCELNGKIYGIGGCVGQRSVPDCQVYDPQTNKWSNIASLNTARYQAAVCSYKGKIYAIGGTDAWSCLNSVEIYDPNTNKWSAGPLLNNPRRGAGCDVLNGKIYVVGGSDGTQSLRSIEILGQEKDMWTLGPALSIPRANVGVAAYANRIFAVGGYSGKKFLDTMEYLDIDNNEWCSYLPVEDSVMAVRKRSQSSEKFDKDEKVMANTSVRNCNNSVNHVHCNGL